MTQKSRPQKVLITGASGGIGAGIAQELAKKSAHVLIHYNAKADGAAATAKAVEELGGTSSIFQADLSDIQQIDKLVRFAIEEMGGIDVLVNNAGVVPKKQILDMEMEEWNQTLQLNLSAPFYLAKMVAKEMINSQTAGTILNISSVYAKRASENFSAYTASKAAINGLTSIQALEWAPYGIRVNAIAPGVTVVDRSKTILERNEKLWSAKIPLKRFGRVEDIGKMALFLASEEASWITGEIFTVDGGMSARANIPSRQELL